MPDWSRVEIVTGRERRRRWSDAEKLRIVAEAEEPGACFSHVARRNEVSRGLLWNWRARVRRGESRPLDRLRRSPLRGRIARAIAAYSDAKQPGFPTQAGR